MIERTTKRGGVAAGDAALSPPAGYFLKYSAFVAM
jgi:hypothetical protein